MRVTRTDTPSVGVRLHRSGSTQTLGIKQALDFPMTDFSAGLFRQFALMHLIAPYLPRVIETDFPVDEPVRRLIDAMYAAKDEHSDGKQPPEFRTPSGRCLALTDEDDVYSPRDDRAIVLYSAGKDSLWNVARSRHIFGPDNVTAVHVGGLNRSNAKQEREFSKRQSSALGFPLRTFELHNGSANTGYGTMRSRDIFLAAIAVPVALQMGAYFIITEGFAEAKPTEPFSGRESSILLFDQTLIDMGIPVRVAWTNKPEMDIIGDMYRELPNWMEHVSNCFTLPYRRDGIRRAWARRAPTLPLHDSQCGSCVKCRLTIVGRILYDVSLSTERADIIEFLSNTVVWVRERYYELTDMLEGSFLRDLKVALAAYGIGDDLARLKSFLDRKQR